MLKIYCPITAKWRSIYFCLKEYENDQTIFHIAEHIHNKKVICLHHWSHLFSFDQEQINERIHN